MVFRLILSAYPCIVEDVISRILQFHDSFPPSVESYRYEDDASFMSSTATSDRLTRVPQV